MRAVSILSLFFIFVSCGNVKNNFSVSNKAKNQIQKTVLSDSVDLIIQSTNLSEDMSTVSSNDDEILVLIYNYSDSTITGKPILSKYFVLNKNKMSDTIHYADKITGFNNNIIFFLLEIDTDKKPEVIEASVRANFKGLIKAYQKRDYTEIEKYIGDDDVLGIKNIEDLKSKRPGYFEFSDIYKMDRFSYHITFK
ncbi:MAG: hypothetical protein ACXVPU_03955 [Bacteroidia bacterium]